MRFWFLEYYEDFDLPPGPAYARVREWREACLAHPAAQQVTKEQIVKLYYDYARGTKNGAMLPDGRARRSRSRPTGASGRGRRRTSTCARRRTRNWGCSRDEAKRAATSDAGGAAAVTESVHAMTGTAAIKEKELRVALVCYGGVSLAIYQHGITKEILKLVRASRAYHAAIAPAQKQRAEHVFKPGRSTAARRPPRMSISMR